MAHNSNTLSIDNTIPTMSSSNCHTAFPDDSEFLDADLHLSGQSADLFDFILEEGEDALFADSSSRDSSDLDALLSDSRGSAAMDFEGFENLEGSLNNTHVGAIQNNEARRSSYSGRRSRRDRSPSPHARGRFQMMEEFSFDPPVQQHDPPIQQCHRQTSQGDLSMSSYATAPTSPMPNNNQRQPVSEHSEGGQCGKAQYNEALRKLADSMKRTEKSRRHLMMQLNMLTPAQKHVISYTKEQLQQQFVTVSPQDAQHQGSTRSLSPGRSSIMAAFFSGSRGTLTNGLDQSRRQLSMYMGQRLG
mmetsp:Transcript_27427/g.58667  ORF Transcript_27427/g.58667 Transcript_27427/m.58667 type:complete len:303 (+) Transcript_27427:57-965(+)